MRGVVINFAMGLLLVAAIGCCERSTSNGSADRSETIIAVNQDTPNERNSSGLIDPLDGVWVYPSEQLGETTLTVIRDMNYKSYRYSANRIDAKADLEREGPAWGQEGVYFFPNRASYYSPEFFQKSNGQSFLLLNKLDYDKFIKRGTVPVQLMIRVGDTLDFAIPPLRSSIEILGLPREVALPKRR